MSNSEMQFADPDWKPPDQRSGNIESQEQGPYIPEPINTDVREQQRSAPPPQPGMYTGSNSYTGSAPRQVAGNPYRPRSYGRRSPLFWIIAALIIFGLMGGFGSSFSRGGPRVAFPAPGGFNGVTESQSFSVGTLPTLIINDPSGSIHIHTGSTSSVSVEAAKQDRNIQISYQQSGNAIDINADNSKGFFKSGSVDFDVTVPSNTNLQLQTDSGDIEVTAVNGQMSLATNSGDITAQQDSLTGQSMLKTNSGSVTYDGSIDTSGSYTFEANSGSVDVTLPTDAAFHVQASTNDGSIDADDFSTSVRVMQNNSGATASGDVGNAPRATVILQTDSGSITLQKQS